VFSRVRSRLNNHFFVFLKKLAIIVVVGLCNIINLAITGRVIKAYRFILQIVVLIADLYPASIFLNLVTSYFDFDKFRKLGLDPLEAWWCI
jgi:hypothetical protein